MFLELLGVPDSEANHALECMCKARAEPAGASIWEPHHSPFLTTIVESFTDNGLRVSAAMADEVLGWVGGRMHVPKNAGSPHPGPWPWPHDKLAAVYAYLSGKTPAEFTFPDWSMLCDYIVSVHASPQFVQQHAGWMAARATALGKLESQLPNLSTAQVNNALASLPSTVEQMLAAFRFNPAQVAAMQYAHARCADSITAVSDDLRARIKSVVLQDMVQAKKPGVPSSTLTTKLTDAFGAFNRDWRRIAVTEAGEAKNQGFIASLPPGAKVRRLEQYAGACSFCKRLHGKVFTVVAADAKNKDGQTQVWPGKSNIGRSASANKIVEGRPVARTADELWWPSAGLQHPHCFIDPDMPVYTSEGWRPISSIKVGDLVLTHRGRFRPVTWVLGGESYSGRAHSFKVAFNGKNQDRTPAMTPEHPVLTARGWVAARDIVVGDSLIALAKTCPTCGEPFVNMKYPHVAHCSIGCAPKSGVNQFSTDDPEALARAKAATSAGGRRRMQGLTVEQRRAITAAGRAVMNARGYAHLNTEGARRAGGVKAASHNYTPTDCERAIADSLRSIGLEATLQHRVAAPTKDSRGRTRYYWLDVALPEQKIAVEIDGEPWHGRLGAARDKFRDAELFSEGWTVLRFDAAAAKSDPESVADEVARVAMNHSGEYRFAGVEVVKLCSRSVRNKTLYNFAVEEDESYVVRGGLVVHNCRGLWVLETAHTPGSDADWAAWLKAIGLVKG